MFIENLKWFIASSFFMAFAIVAIVTVRLYIIVGLKPKTVIWAAIIMFIVAEIFLICTLFLGN